MAVKVTTTDKNNYDGEYIVRNYPTGALIEIKMDGHLVVTGPSPVDKDFNSVLAIYAPGKWHHADLLPEEEKK